MAQRRRPDTSKTASRHVVASPLERAQETAGPLAAAHGLEVGTDDRVIESTNVFQGKRFGVGDGVLKQAAQLVATCATRASPRGASPTRRSSARMLAAVDDARDAARGHEAVLVSHQLPVWTTRLHVEGSSFVHDPRTPAVHPVPA